MQEAVVNELQGKQRQQKQRQVINRSEIAHGTLDDLINGMYNIYLFIQLFLLIYSFNNRLHSNAIDSQ